MKQATTAALIQLAESIFITALISGIVAASSTITDNGKIDWTVTGGAFALMFVFSLAHSLAAYVKTLPAPNNVSMDDLSTVLDNFITQIQQRVQMPQNSAQKAAGPSPILLNTVGATSQTHVVQASQHAPVYDTLPSIGAVGPAVLQPQPKQ